MNHLDERQLAIHVPILGWLQIVFNAVLFLVGVIGLVFLGGIGLLVQDPMAFRILTFIGGIGFVFFAVLGLPGILAGTGLLLRKHWGRILSIVLGLLSLAAFPVGTVLGAYAIFVLLQDAATPYFQPEQAAS